MNYSAQSHSIVTHKQPRYTIHVDHTHTRSCAQTAAQGERRISKCSAALNDFFRDAARTKSGVSHALKLVAPETGAPMLRQFSLSLCQKKAIEKRDDEARCILSHSLCLQQRSMKLTLFVRESQQIMSRYSFTKRKFEPMDIRTQVYNTRDTMQAAQLRLISASLPRDCSWLRTRARVL